MTYPEGMPQVFESCLDFVQNSSIDFSNSGNGSLPFSQMPTSASSSKVSNAGLTTLTLQYALSIEPHADPASSSDFGNSGGEQLDRQLMQVHTWTFLVHECPSLSSLLWWLSLFFCPSDYKRLRLAFKTFLGSCEGSHWHHQSAIALIGLHPYRKPRCLVPLLQAGLPLSSSCSW